MNFLDKIQNTILSKRTKRLRPTWKLKALGLHQNEIELRNALLECGVEISTMEIFTVVDGIARTQTILDYRTMSNTK